VGRVGKGNGSLDQRFPTGGKFPPMEEGNLGVSGGNSGQAGNFQKFRTALIIELGSPKWAF